MKKIRSIAVIAVLLLSIGACAQKPAEDKSKRPSPPAMATATINSLKISIDYSTPFVKGRTIGKDLEPKDGQVWRTGANEATIFEISQDATINGNKLTAGKYSLFTLFNGNECTIIFNKTWNQWGAYDYKEAADALRVKVPVQKAGTVSEKMNFSINNAGTVTLLWGDISVSFDVKPA